MGEQEDGEEAAGAGVRSSKAFARLLSNVTVKTLWIYVLYVLKRRPTYPYDVKRTIREEFGFNPPTVTLYTVMYRLERDGFIRRDPNGMYYITSRGLEALKEAAVVLTEIAEKISAAAYEPAEVRQEPAKGVGGPQEVGAHH